MTGAGGLIGSAVVRELHRAGLQVTAHLGPPGYAGVPPPPGVRHGTAEITDLPAVRALCRDVVAVVHLAGPPSVAASFRDPVGCARSHVVGTATVLQACADAGVRRLVHLSSAEVYGAAGPDPVAEPAPTRPRSPYAAAKLGAEHLVTSWTGRAGLGTVVLRPFSVYGPGSPPTSLVGTVLRAVATGDAVEVRSLATTRDYVHVEDVARAVALALRHPDGGAPVFNVGSGTGTSVATLASLAMAGAGRVLPLRETGQDDRPAGHDLDVLVADVRRAQDELGWVPGIALADGLAAAVRALSAAAT